MNIKIEEKQWRITRQPPVAAGARAEGDYNVSSQPGGLWFHPDHGQSLFLPLAEVPSEEDLKNTPLKKISEWMQRAQQQ